MALQIEKAAAAEAQVVETQRQALRVAMQALTPEQIAAVGDSFSLDDDADGLTNTEETWWCTDPLNPYTRDDPNNTGGGIVTDSEYVRRLLEYLYHPEQGDSRLGVPFAGWPMVPLLSGLPNPYFKPSCLDGDGDAVPDQIEMFVIGSNPNRESTSADRYDDGQKFFGTTAVDWGLLPRAADGAYATANLPGFVDWPGRSLFAAHSPSRKL